MSISRRRRKSPRLARALHGLFYKCESLESRLLLTAVSWDGGPTGTGTLWTDPLNWSTDTLPGAADDVTISLAANPVITLGSGTQSINSLTSDEALTISGGVLTLASASTINGAFVLSGATSTAPATSP